LIGVVVPSRYRKSLIALGTLALGTSAAAALVPAVSLAKPKPKLVKVEDDFYSPKKLTIKRGNQLNYVWNKNNIDSHNVILVSGPKGISHTKFSSGTATSGIKFKPTFTKVGTYHFKCTIHPATMTMTVIVKK
jgi:plastocyanin